MARLRAGTASVDITPDDPVPMGGYGGREGTSTGVHDSMSATSLVVSDGAVTVGVVSVDLLNVSRELTARIRRRLDGTDAAIDEVMVAATHTHSGPYIPAAAIDVNPHLAQDVDVSGYLETVERSCVESLRAAHDALEPATLRVGRAENDESPVNRRAGEGWARFPTGRVDPELVAISVRTASGEETVVVNFAMHPVCLPAANTRLSADWPATVYDRVADARDGATVLFLNGAAGEINPRGGPAGGDTDDAFDHAATIGEEVAETTLDALERARDAPAVERPTISAERRRLRLPVKSAGDPDTLRAHQAELEAELDRLREEGNEAAVPHVSEQLKHVTELASIAEWEVTHLPTELQYVEVGPLGLLGLAGETLVDHGLAFKDAAAVDTLLPVGYANGYVGYVPTLAELERVGYEVWTAKIAPEAITRFREAGLDLVSNT